jgi:hypothetical protein
MNAGRESLFGCNPRQQPRELRSFGRVKSHTECVLMDAGDTADLLHDGSSSVSQVKSV